MTDRTAVTFTVEGIEMVHGTGRLVALANVLMEIAGVEVMLQGVQVIRAAEGGALVQSPTFRHPKTGRWTPGVLLPPELREAIGAEVVACLSEAAKSALEGRGALPSNS